MIFICFAFELIESQVGLMDNKKDQFLLNNELRPKSF